MSPSGLRFSKNRKSVNSRGTKPQVPNSPEIILVEDEPHHRVYSVDAASQGKVYVRQERLNSVGEWLPATINLVVSGFTGPAEALVYADAIMRAAQVARILDSGIWPG